MRPMFLEYGRSSLLGCNAVCILVLCRSLTKPGAKGVEISGFQSSSSSAVPPKTIWWLESHANLINQSWALDSPVRLKSNRWVLIRSAKGLKMARSFFSSTFSMACWVAARIKSCLPQLYLRRAKASMYTDSPPTIPWTRSRHSPFTFKNSQFFSSGFSGIVHKSSVQVYPFKPVEGLSGINL